MRINIVFPGKIKDNYIKKGIEKYRKMLTGKVKLELVSVKDESVTDISNKEKILDAEAERIMKIMNKHDYNIVLEQLGETPDSVKFAKTLEKLAVSGKSRIGIIIGSALGLSEKVKKKGDVLISLSSFTLPHQIVLLVISEQIFRAVKINNGETYHY